MEKLTLEQEQAYRLILQEFPDVLDIDEMCQVLKISTKTGYRLLKEKKIEGIKVGRSYRILKISVFIYLGLSVSSPELTE